MTQSNGAAAMSVEMCAVTAIRKAEGTAASPTQIAASRHVGSASSAASDFCAGNALRERRSSTPHTAIMAISRKNRIDQVGRLLSEPTERLDEERITQEREKTADVARGIEEVRVPR